MSSFGWGYMPMQAAPTALDAAAAAADAETIDTIHLVTSRASAPSLGEFLAELYNSELLSDITICSEDGQAIRCHKLVLIRWSAPLRRMLCGDMREAREARITLRGVEGEVVAAFLRFLYTCSCAISPDRLVGLAAMADQYDVPLLQQLCMDAIRTYAANHRCCCLFYKAAKEVQQQEIQQLAWQQLASNLNSLVRHHAVFVQLELEDVLRLCGRPRQQEEAATAAAAAAGQQPWPPGEAAAGAAAAGAAAAEVAAAAAEPAGGGAGADGGAEAPAVAAAGAAPAAGSGVVVDDDTVAFLLATQIRPRSPPPGRAAQPLGRPWFVPRAQEAAAAAAAARPRPASQAAGLAAAPWALGLPQPAPQQPRRPEYALFLALMAWLDHDAPARQQHKQLLLGCLDLDAMTSTELSQMRSSPHVQGDPQLKDMLLDALARRCLQHAQQPVYNMAPLPHERAWG